MFEHRSEPVLARSAFLLRQSWHLVLAVLIVGVSLVLGAIGYHYFDDQNWIDAAYSATMILTAMGPSGTPKTDAGKLFGITYALFSGIAVITTVTLLLTPMVHRILHQLHADDAEAVSKAAGRKSETKK